MLQLPEPDPGSGAGHRAFLYNTAHAAGQPLLRARRKPVHACSFSLPWPYAHASGDATCTRPCSAYSALHIHACLGVGLWVCDLARAAEHAQQQHTTYWYRVRARHESRNRSPKTGRPRPACARLGVRQELKVPLHDTPTRDDTRHDRLNTQHTTGSPAMSHVWPKKRNTQYTDIRAERNNRTAPGRLSRALFDFVFRLSLLI